MRQNYFISTQGATVKRKDNQIVIYFKNEKLGEIPVNLIDNLFIFGNIHLSINAINFMLAHDIDIFLSTLGGKLRGLITKFYLKSDYKVRLKQYSAFNNSQKKSKITKFIVFNKIQQIEKYSDLDLTSLKEKLLGVTTYNEVLGIEGRASALFFEDFKRKLMNKYGFKERKYYPSPDPVNTILSLVYTLYHNVLFSIITSKGFDPYIGFLHRKRGSHSAFVSDIIEYSRPALTIYVLNLFNSGFFKWDDFKKGKGYSLKSEKSKQFFQKVNEDVLKNSKYLNDTQIFLNQLESML